MGTMDGIRVVEIADYVFIPATGGVLADWGADVIKIEHHETGDPLRGVSAFFGSADVVPKANAVLEAANRGKRSIGLNLATQEGRDILYQLVEGSDVFITSKLEATRRKLGFSVEDLRRANPDLIYVKGSGHGERGPEGGTGGVRHSRLLEPQRHRPGHQGRRGRLPAVHAEQRLRGFHGRHVHSGRDRLSAVPPRAHG